MRLCIGFALAGTLLFFFVPIDVAACDCVYPGRPCNAFAQSAYVFSGKVTKVSKTSVQSKNGEYQEPLYTFAVEGSYRGLNGKPQAEVVSGSGGGDCGYTFKEGERYLVYAGLDQPSGKLYTSICSRTRLLSDAVDDLKYFAEKDDPAHGAGIEGWIDELSRDPDNSVKVIGPLKGAHLKVSSKSRHWIVTTGEDGRFQLWGLQPGTYVVTPQFAPKFAEDSRTIVLKAKSCADVRFLATPPPHKKQG